MESLKKLTNQMMRNLPVIIGLIILLMDLVAVLAPVFAHLGITFISDGIYFVYSFLCHQRSWRSLHIFDHQVAWCTRDTFIYLSMGLSAVFVGKFNVRNVKWYVPLILIIPFAADGLIQLIAEFQGLMKDQEVYFYASTNFVRMLTGSLFGTGAGLWIFSLLDETLEEEMGEDFEQKKTEPKISAKKAFGFILSICVVFYILFIQAWRLTSVKYKPSGFLEHKRYFPGYNYEVTDRCGHCQHSAFSNCDTATFLICSCFDILYCSCSGFVYHLDFIGQKLH